MYFHNIVSSNFNHDVVIIVKKKVHGSLDTHAKWLCTNTVEDICAVYRHALTVSLYLSFTAVRPCVRTCVLKHILTKTLLMWYNTRSSVLWG